MSFKKIKEIQYLETCAVCYRSKVYYLRVWLHNKISVCRLVLLVNCALDFRTCKYFRGCGDRCLCTEFDNV